MNLSIELYKVAGVILVSLCCCSGVVALFYDLGCGILCFALALLWVGILQWMLKEEDLKCENESL